MSRVLVPIALLTWAGATLVLSELRWFRRLRLTTRLAPYSPTPSTSARGRNLSVASFGEVVGPLARSFGATLSAALGIEEDLATRLARIHSSMDPTSFRLRQLGYAVVALVCGTATTLALTPHPLLSALLLLGAPVLAFLIPEQQLATACERWQRHVFLELPVVAEQLGMLLSTGYSLGSALNRLADRGQGACGADMRRVCARIRYGAEEIDALHEWGSLVQVPAVERLIAVLSLNREAGSLGRLISEEARAIRRDAQRELIEAMERRAQLVWIPVTVAALLPGTLFLVVPFVEAMRLFTNS